MRMKKILILAVAATALVACAKSFDKSTSEGQAIGFGTWTEVMTKGRATASNNTAFENGDAFDVYGFKTTANGNTVVFNGDDVTATVSGSTVSWDYTQHRFWDPAATSYTFYAVLPANQLAAEATTDAYATTGKFTSSAITFDDPLAFDNDILVATPKVVAKADFGTSVELTFNHIATCVDLKLKKDNKLGDAVVKITALSLLNIHNAGHFSITYPTDVPVASWAEESTVSYLGTSSVYPVTLPSGGAVAAGKTTYATDTHVGTTTGDAGVVFAGYVFMPQTILTSGTQQQIKFTYTLAVGNEEPIEYKDNIINICDFITSDKDIEAGDYTDTEKDLRVGNWNPKTHYIYTITIGAGNVIEFTAKVAEWATTDVNGYQYLLN